MLESVLLLESIYFHTFTQVQKVNICHLRHPLDGNAAGLTMETKTHFLPSRTIAGPFPFLTAKPILPAGLNSAYTAGFVSAQASHWSELRFHFFIYLFLQTLLTIPRKRGLKDRKSVV